MEQYGLNSPHLRCSGDLPTRRRIHVVSCQSDTAPRSRRVAENAPHQPCPIVVNRPKSRLIVPNQVGQIRANSRNSRQSLCLFGFRLVGFRSSDFIRVHL